MFRIVVVLMIVGLCVHTASALPGSGTQQDPWRIESLADFDEFAADPNYWAGYTRLETDVNLAGRTYSTAVIAPDVNNSNYDFDGTAFTCVFDGNDHKIINLTINGGANEYLGLFGYIGEGEVRNLRLEGGSVSGRSDYVGGLVGRNYFAQITNCYSAGSVSGNVNVGGLVGLNSYGTITGCYLTGSVSGVGDYAGGLVGRNYSGPITNSYSTGSVSGHDGVGGLVGENDSSGMITKCYSTGSASGNYAVGGLVGWNKSTVTASFWDRQTSGRTTSAGGVGKTTAEMNTKSTFTSAGWDFVEIWLINEGATYPVLRQEIRSDLNGNGGVDFADFAIFADHWLEGTGG